MPRKPQEKEMCVIGIRVPKEFKDTLQNEAGNQTLTSLIMERINNYGSLLEENEKLKKGIKEFNLLMKSVGPTVPDFIDKTKIIDAVKVSE